MNAAELRRLEALLEGAAELARRDRLLPPTAASDGGATVEDYSRARELVADLAIRLPALSPAERERLELNADLPQLTFHLGEELAAVDRAGVEPDTLARSLGFLKRHLVRLEAEFVDRAHTRLDADELALVTGLTRLARREYERRFARHYRELGYRRPFIDKLYRDYALTGIPDGLLLELAGLAERDAHDAVICVLKGGLAYALLLELLGLPAARLRHVICGRATGSHVAPTYIVRPLDFAMEDMRGRSVLVVENNAATGATLAHLAAPLRGARPERLTLFLDYILTDAEGLSAASFERLGFTEVGAGPYAATPAGRERAPALRRELLTAVERRCAAPPTVI